MLFSVNNVKFNPGLVELAMFQPALPEDQENHRAAVPAVLHVTISGRDYPHTGTQAETAWQELQTSGRFVQVAENTLVNDVWIELATLVDGQEANPETRMPAVAPKLVVTIAGRNHVFSGDGVAEVFAAL